MVADYKCRDSGNSSKALHKKDDESKDSDLILSLCILLTTGVLVRLLLKKLPFPYTVVLLIIGCLLGFSANYSVTIEQFVTPLININPHMIQYIFLPVLIFDSAFCLDVHVMSRSIVQILLIAVLGFSLASALTGLFCLLAFPFGWNWTSCFMFGALVSATDPVAVVALLNEVIGSSVLGTLIEGESLLNDGVAIVLYHIFQKLEPEAIPIENNDLIKTFLLPVCGPLLGYFMGKVTVLCLDFVHDDGIVEIMITFVSAYLTFFIGEQTEVSGVLATVVLGLVVNTNKTSISQQVEKPLHHFWDIIVYISNTLIFIISGLIIFGCTDFKNDFVTEIGYLLLLYVMVNLIRFTVVGLLFPFLRRFGYGFSVKSALIVSWSGLRGALALSLALMVAQTHKRDHTYRLNVGSKVLFYTAGIVFLTLVINGSTVGPIMRLLKMNIVTTSEVRSMRVSLNKLRNHTAATISSLRENVFLADANWTLVAKFTEVVDPYSEVDKASSLQERAFEYTDTVKRFIKMQTMSYHRQYKSGTLGAMSLQYLQRLSDYAMDNISFVEFSSITKYLSLRKVYIYIENKLLNIASSYVRPTIPPPKYSLLKIFYKIAIAPWFENTMQFLVFINLFPVVIELVMHAKNPLPDKPTDEECEQDNINYYELNIINHVFFAIYCLEALIRMLGERKYYFFSRWNWLDFAVLVLCVVDIAIEDAYPCKQPITGDLSRGVKVTKGFKFAKFLKTIRILRGIRMLRIVVVFLLKLVQQKMNKQLSVGYDMAHGQLLAEDASLAMIVNISKSENALNAIRAQIRTNRAALHHCLGNLEVRHHGIAISLKTKHACRLVINNQTAIIHSLSKNGVIGHSEFLKLYKTFVHDRIILYHTTIPACIPSACKEFNKIRWLCNCPTNLELVQAEAVLMKFKTGDELMTLDKPAAGVLVITSGFVAVSLEISAQNSWGALKSKGSVIGELEFLHSIVENENNVRSTDTSRIEISVTARADSNVEAYFIGSPVLLKCLDNDETMFDELWKTCAMREGGRLLMDEGWLLHHTKAHLSYGYIEHIANSTYTVGDGVSTLVLIQGVAKGSVSTYTGPCLIPVTEEELTFTGVDLSHIKLLVVAESIESTTLRISETSNDRASTDINVEVLNPNAAGYKKSSSTQFRNWSSINLKPSASARISIVDEDGFEPFDGGSDKL